MKVKFVTVFSPHLDDAVLSLGDHIVKWKRQGKKVRVITVFTKFENAGDVPDYSKDYLRVSGFTKVGDFENARIREDKRAMEMMGVDYEHWGFIDAGFRGVYNQAELMLGGVIDKKDYGLKKQLENKVWTVPTTDNLWLIPYGVGGHADHVLVNEVCSRITASKNYYLDVPYIWRNNNYFKMIKEIFRLRSLMRESGSKREILECYKSQYNQLVWDDKIWAEVILSGKL